MKKIILAIIIVLMTGCSVNYSVAIDDDLKITEKAVIVEDAEFYENYYHTTPINVLSGIIDNYKSILDEKKYTYYIVDKPNPEIVIEKSYDSYNDYIQNTILLNDYFEKINFVKNEDVLKISTEGFNPNDTDNPERFYIDELEIDISSKYKVLNHNADSYNKRNNTYFYKMKADTKEFNILMELNISKKFNPLEEYFVTILVTILIAVAAWIFVIIKKKNKY